MFCLDSCNCRLRVIVTRMYNKLRGCNESGLQNRRRYPSVLAIEKYTSL